MTNFSKQLVSGLAAGEPSKVKLMLFKNELVPVLLFESITVYPEPLKLSFTLVLAPSLPVTFPVTSTRKYDKGGVLLPYETYRYPLPVIFPEPSVLRPIVVLICG